MRIGLFGGTFDPIHFGHLRAGIEVKEGFDLDACYLIPAAIPPHKRSDTVVNADDRLEMIRLAITGYAGFVLSDVELRRSGPSYTVDTVATFKGRLPDTCELFWILGIDAFLEIHTWKSYRKLMQLLPFIVMTRPGEDWDGGANPRLVMKKYLHAHVSDTYVFSESTKSFVNATLQPVFVHDITLIDISSSKIRKLIKTGKSIHFLVPERVGKFIRDKGLYR